MESLQADHAILLATLGCVVFPLFFVVIYLRLQPRWKTAKKKVKTYRVRGIPLDWDESRLGDFLKENDVDMKVKSMALSIRGDKQMATGTVKDAPTKPPIVPGLRLDGDFHGLTTFYAPSPEDHKIDIVAISGLGGHAFGSFKARNAADHMWLRDALPEDIIYEQTRRPMARILTYGYNSGVANSSSHDNLATLANRFNSSLSALADAPTPKPLILIAHSLGGLIVKQAMVEMSRSKVAETAKLYNAIYGIVFFGVPHEGMTIDFLKPMVGDGPNRSLVESLDWKNSMNTDELSRSFQFGLGGQGESEVFCFYETLGSPVPEPDPEGGWRMSKDRLEYLVSKQSATRYCEHWVPGMDHECGIAKNHSDMVKFERGDIEYDNVQEKLRGIAKRALVRKPRINSTLEGLMPVIR